MITSSLSIKAGELQHQQILTHHEFTDDLGRRPSPTAKDEVARIRQAMLSGSTLLGYGPRSIGQSSVAINAAELAHVARPKPIIVDVDISAGTSIHDVATRLIRSLYVETRWLKFQFENLMNGVTLEHQSWALDIKNGLHWILDIAFRRR